MFTLTARPAAAPAPAAPATRAPRVVTPYLSRAAAALAAKGARRARKYGGAYYPPNGAAPFTPVTVRLTRAPRGGYGWVLTVTGARRLARRNGGA